MKKYSSWINALFTLIFIAVPSLIGLFFIDNVSFGFLWLIGIGIVICGFLLAFLFYKLDLLSIEVFNFSIPISLVFLGLFVSYHLEWWIMLLISIFFIFCAFPINILVSKIKSKNKIDLNKIDKKTN